MNVCILTSQSRMNEKYVLLDNSINKLIEDSGNYLFTVLCGKQEETELGRKWAVRNGAPVRYIKASSSAELIDKVLYFSDYIIFILDGTAAISNAFMRYKDSRKHGTVIRLERT